MSAPLHAHSARLSLDALIVRAGQRLTFSRECYWRLIRAVRASSTLLVPRTNRGRTDPDAIERVILGCVRMAQHGETWVRPPEEWCFQSASPNCQFRSLVNHLFARYPVPRFLTQVWTLAGDRAREIAMYLHLASGQSIRDFVLPVPYRLGKQAAVYFLHAPADLLPMQALRWSQIRSLGGYERLARLLVSRTVLTELTAHEAVWESVIRFLVKQAPMGADEIVDIIQFVHQQRFQPAEVILPGGGPLPLQPDLTLDGRSLMSLRRLMANWREELRPRFVDAVPEYGSRQWPRTTIRSFRQFINGKFWTIDELLTDKELRVEGGILQHCVADYVKLCARRDTSIWSLKVHEGDSHRRILTIEVIPETKLIRQAKGKRNAPPTAPVAEVLRAWAEQEGLRFVKTV